jgi:hypothetical protein
MPLIFEHERYPQCKSLHLVAFIHIDIHLFVLYKFLNFFAQKYKPSSNGYLSWSLPPAAFSTSRLAITNAEDPVRLL